MNRLLRRFLRNRQQGNFLTRLFEKRNSASSLHLESLENRVLLTTLIYPKDALGETVFIYADPNETEPGADDITEYNEIRISTLSGQPPSQDVIIEILDYEGKDINGTLTTPPTPLAPGSIIDIGGGPAGGSLIQEVPIDDLVGTLGFSVSALATNSDGITYGLAETAAGGSLVRIDTQDGTGVLVGEVVDAQGNPATAQAIGFNDFLSAEFVKDVNGADVLYAVATGPAGFDTFGSPLAEDQSMLITIDVFSGEVTPVGRDDLGQPDYVNSRVALESNDLDVVTRTIVFSQEADHNPITTTNTPVFLGFGTWSPTIIEDGAVVPDDDTIDRGLITIEVLDQVGDSVVVETNEYRFFNDEDVIIDGMIYDSQGRLFGLHHTDEDSTNLPVDWNDGQLVIIEPDALPDQNIIEIIEFGQYPENNDIWLTGFTYNPEDDFAYATDPVSGTLYKIGVERVIVTGGGGDAEITLTGLSDVYTVYIAQADADTLVTFTPVTIDGGGITYHPTSGDTPPLFTDEDNSVITTPADAGGVQIGTIPRPVGDDIIWTAGDFEGVVGTFFNPTEFGPYDGEFGFPGTPATGATVMPAHGAYPGGIFRPGIVLAEQNGEYQHIGRIQVGGSVFGDVIINGGIDTFYAGFLATNRFVVEGDLNNLMVNTYAGGIPDSDGGWTEVNSARYSLFEPGSGPTLDVFGQLASFYTNLDWGLPTRVHGLTTAPDFPGMLMPGTTNYKQVHHEMERKVTAAPSGSTFPLGGLETSGGYIFNNDSPYTAQFLGTTANGDIRLVGEQEGTIDPEDFYSFGLMAGQTVEIRVFSAGFANNIFTGYPTDPDSQTFLTDTIFLGTIDVFDPQLNWIANDGEVDKLTGTAAPLVLTAEEAGIYTIAVNGAFGGSQILGFNYRLEITGVEEAALGGGNIVNDIRRDFVSDVFTSEVPIIQVVGGNMGALNVGGYARNARIQVDDGDLMAIRAGGNALPPSVQIQLRPFGGAVAAPAAPIQGFGFEFEDATAVASLGLLTVGGDVGSISSPVKSALNIQIDGMLQSLRIGEELTTPAFGEASAAPGDEEGSYFGLLTVDGNIGEIRISGSVATSQTSDVGTSIAGSATITGIFANADSMGEPGVIDVLQVGGDLETIISVGDRGGNLRFADVRGSVLFVLGGISFSDIGDISFDPGKSVTIVDDSGALIKIAPGYKDPDEDEALVEPGTIGDDDDDTDDEDDALDEGGILTLKLVPVFDITPEHWLTNGFVNKNLLGYAVASINSTDGLRLSSDGGPVEVGYVSVDGINDDRVVLSGKYAVNALAIAVPPPVTEPVDEDGDGTDDNVIIIPDDPDTEEDESQEIQRVGISEVVNSSGHWEHLMNGKWMPGKGQFSRWVGGDIISLMIGSGSGDRNVSVEAGDDGDDSTITFEEIIEEQIIYPFRVVRTMGNLGITANTTGQVIKGSIISPEDADIAVDPGAQQTNGLVSEVGIEIISVAGAIGELDVRDNVGRIIANADNSDFDGQFHGITGPITIYGGLQAIDVGDGLLAPGTGWEAQSGIFVYGTLNRVVATGLGHDIEGPVYSAFGINSVQALKGASILGYNRAFQPSERVQGSLGASPSVYVSLFPEDFQLESNVFGGSGTINEIKVIGQEGKIDGATIYAQVINRVYVNGGAEGIFHTEIIATGSFTSDIGLINQILVGGQGIHNSSIVAERDLGQIVVKPGGDITNSEIRGLYYLGRIMADRIDRVDIDAPLKLDFVYAREDVYDLAIEAGELGILQSRESILGSSLVVGGPVSRIYAGGDLISTLEVTGPFGDLRYLLVGGDLGTPNGGEIIVDGKIGTVKVTGDFNAGLLLNWEPGTPAQPLGFKKYERFGNEVDKLIVGGDMASFGSVGGDIGMIFAGGDFGSLTEPLTIDGDLNKLIVGSGRDPGLLQSNLNVKGNLGQVVVFGDVNGDFEVEEDFNALILKGIGENRADLNGDVSVGGDFNKLFIVNGDRNGSLFIDGNGPKEVIKGSDITSNTIITGSSGDVHDGFSIDGSLKNDVRYVSAINTNKIYIGGDIEEGAVLVIDGDLQELVVEGNILGHVHVTGDIGLVQAANIGDNTVVATVTAGGSIDRIMVEGTIEDSYVLAGFDPGVGESLNLAEYDDGDLSAGFDITRFTVDGTDADSREKALSGSIRLVQVGTLFNSVVAAGVSPGINSVFGDSDGSDRPGIGLSSISKVMLEAVRGKEGEGGADQPYGIFADSNIGVLRIGKNAIPVPVLQAGGFRAWTLTSQSQTGIGGIIFEPGRPFSGMIIDAENHQVPITISISGDGVGQVLLKDDGTGIEAIQLEGTTERSSIIVSAAGRSVVDVERLFTNDDESLNMLLVDGVVGGSDVINDLYIGGGVNKLMIGGLAEGSKASIGGDIRLADLGTVEGVTTATDIDVNGSIMTLMSSGFGDHATLTADAVRQMVVIGDMDGTVLLDKGDLNAFILKNGIFKGAISVDGDINRIITKGRAVGQSDFDINSTYQGQVVSIYGGTIRSGGDIASLTSMNLVSLAVIAAGRDLNSVTVRDNVEFSTIAAGLDIGSGLDLFDVDAVVPSEGDLDRVIISGELLQSNLVAGVSPGEDKFFGTNDDRLDPKNSEKFSPPRIIDVSFGWSDAGKDLKTINVVFDEEPIGLASEIGLVQVGGVIEGSNSPGDRFAIVAAGSIGSVKARKETFRSSGNVLRTTVGGMDILGSTIEESSLKTLEDALAASFIIQADGFDHQFEELDLDDIRSQLAADPEADVIPGDDSIIFGEDVWVEFDPETNTAVFHKDAGFNINIEGTNYYRILLDSSQIVNRAGVPLDGKFAGSWPTGVQDDDGNFVPDQNGTDFVYYFAVGDIGNTDITAFSPFESDFPENTSWSFTSTIGDDPRLKSEDISDDADFYLFRNLKEGHVLNMVIKDLSNTNPLAAISPFNASNTLQAQVWKIEPAKVEGGGVYVPFQFNGLDELDPARDLLVPFLSELAYTGGTIYGYDDWSQQFYAFDDVFNIDEVIFDVDTLNNLPELVSEGSFISNIHGVAGRVGNALWAVATIQTPTEGARDSLILIENINPSNDTDPNLIVSQLPFADSITALAEMDGVLYGFNDSSDSLVTIGSDPDDLATFGQIITTQALRSDEGVGGEDLIITGLEVLEYDTVAGDREKVLLALHDQPGGDARFDNTLVEALFAIDPGYSSEEASLELWLEMSGDNVVSGLTVKPGAAIYFGAPVWGSPVGDTIEVTFDDVTQEHTFGSDERIEFAGAQAITITSDPDFTELEELYSLRENAEQREFIDGGFYYAFNVEYLAGAGLDEFTIAISGIDWLDSETGLVNEDAILDSFFTDDPDAVDIFVQQVFDPVTFTFEETLFLTITPIGGDGDVKVFFASNARINEIVNTDLNAIDKVIGEGSRDDFDTPRDMIMPGMDEFTIAPETLLTRNVIPDLPQQVADALEGNQAIIDQLGGEITDDIIQDVFDELFDNLDVFEAASIFNLFLSNIAVENYNALGLDTEQDVFALVSTNNFSARPVFVTNPLDTEETVALSVGVIGQIYNQIDPDILINDIRGLEFGQVDDEEGTVEVWGIASYTRVINDVTRETISQESLIRIGDITNPAATIDLSTYDMESAGFTDINELAFGDFDFSDPDLNVLYGLDVDSQTLVRIDTTASGFGEVEPVGGEGQTGNLSSIGDIVFDIIGMDFNRQGQLMALEASSNLIIEISTDPFVRRDYDRAQLIQKLPQQQSFRTLTYDPNQLDPLFGGFDTLLTTGFLVETVTGSPLNDMDGIQVAVITANQGTHSGLHNLSSQNTTPLSTGSGSVTLNSATGNSPVEVNNAGGFYHLDIGYSSGQGTIQVVLEDIEWVGGSGGIDSVAVSDTDNVTVVDFDLQTITLEIDTGNANGSFELFFGATSEIYVPTNVNYSLSFVSAHAAALSDMIIEEKLPEDGDYFIRISDINNILGDDQPTVEYITPYRIEMLLFNDGNSDFGVAQGDDVYETSNGFIYDPVVPDNSAINLTPDQNEDYPDAFTPDPNPEKDNLYHINDPHWPLRAQGTFPRPGETSTLVIDSELALRLDADVYSFQMVEGQRVTINIDADTLFGQDDILLIAGVYNADLEALGSVFTTTDLTVTGPESVDPFYTVQAAFDLPGHEDVVIDPNVDGVGTYYVVISGLGFGNFTFSQDPIPYRLTITTEKSWDKNDNDQKENVEKELEEIGLTLDDIDDDGVVLPKSQLVWLAFGDLQTDTNAAADYLHTEAGFNIDAVNRPAFKASDFGLDEFDYRDDLIESIAALVEQMYRDVGLTEDEIEFTTIKPGSQGSPYPPGAVYSTVIMGGKLSGGTLGLAENVDRNNMDRTDMAVVLTAEIGDSFSLAFTGKPNTPERFEETVNLLANVAAHELAHIFGLEHAREVQAAEPSNLMNYYWFEEESLQLEPLNFQPHNSFDEFAARHYPYTLNLLGYSNEIDQLLRSIGSSSPIGA